MPAAPDLKPDLAALPHFRDLPPERRAKVAALARLVEVAAGEDVFREGQRCDGFYSVKEGLVRIYKRAPDGRDQVIHLIGPGHTFAEAALFHFGIFPASA